MSATTAGLLQLALLLAALAAIHRPLGDHMARVYTSEKDLRVERVIYRVARVDPSTDQRWTGYGAGVLGFAAVSVVFLYLMQRVQPWGTGQHRCRAGLRPPFHRAGQHL